MDFLKILLWLFLVKSTVSMGTCEFGKYFVPDNNDINHENCFCFKKPGEHRTVPEILNQNNNNIERLVVYLYKDKITSQVKLYIPNEEKQSLVPDLAFEVGDNINTLDNNKVKDIFNLYVRFAPVYNKLPTKHEHHKQPDYTNGSKILSSEITTPDPADNLDNYFDENPHFIPAKIPSSQISKPEEGIYYYDPSNNQHREPSYIDSKPVNKPDSDEYIDEYDPDRNYDKIPKDINQPKENVYDNNNDIYKPREDFINFPSEEVNIPAEIKPADDNNHSEPGYIKNVPSDTINIPSAPIDTDGYDFHGKPPYYDDINRPQSQEIYQPNNDVNNHDKSIVYNKFPSNIDFYESDYINPIYNDYNYLQPEHLHYHTNNPKQVKIPTDERYIHSNVPQRLDFEDYQPKNDGGNIWDIDTHKNEYKPSEGHSHGHSHSHSHGHSHDHIHGTPTIHGESTVQHPKHHSDYQPSKEISSKENESGAGHTTNTIVVENTSNHKIYPNTEKHTNENNEAYVVSSEDTYETRKDTYTWDAYQHSFEDFNDKTHSNAIHQSFEDQKISPIHSNNEYETFDRWFVQQMQRFKTYTEHDRAINFITIERSILKILQDNDMHVTDEGVLTDSYGTAIDVTNLHLRPILIGNTMAFGSILNDQATDLVMPANMAYLQAILVTNSRPSMILGIIPIGKTVIPPSAINAFSTLLEPHVYSSWSQSTHHQTHSSTAKPSESIGVNMGYIKEKKPIVLHLTRKTKPIMLSPKKTKTLITVVKESPIIVSHYQRHHQPVKSFQFSDNIYGNDDIVLSLESAEAVTKFATSLRDGNDPIKSAEATNLLLASLRKGKEQSTAAPDKSNEDEVNEDDIAQRIIGGSAATSSGAPLSVKGRINDVTT